MDNSKYLVVATVYIVGLLYCASGATPSNSSSETGLYVTDQHQQCPTWFFWNVTSRKCKCGPSYGVDILCFQARNLTQLSHLWCITFDSTTDSTVAGFCPYGDPQGEHDRYILLPKNRSKLNKVVCGKGNREGLLCSRCRPGYGPSPLSYDHACGKCSNSHFGWFLYLCVALIPTTLFFIVIVLCEVRTTSASLNFYVFASQLYSIYVAVYPHGGWSYSQTTKLIYGIGATALLTSWNLDFFRLLIPPFCVSENLSNLQMLSMDYIVAFYPLLLTVVMYVCIQQHARGCRVLVCLWKPFGYGFTPLMRRFDWKPATSIVPIFASLLLLSSTKILTVSSTLLYTGHVIFNMSNNGVITLCRNCLYYDQNIIFFSQDHLPYAVLAIIVSSTFVILPCLVLILYPTCLFQRFLNWCGIGCHAVHAFADAFNGCYKNGTNGTRDCRCFAGFYLLLRICFVFHVHVHTPVPQTKLLLLTFVFIFALASPYKNRLFNVSDSCCLALLACRACITEYAYVINIIAGAIILLYFTALVSCTVILKFNCSCSQELKALADQISDAPHTERQEVADQVRIENPDGHRLLTEVNEQSQHFNNDSNIPTYGSIQ